MTDAPLHLRKLLGRGDVLAIAFGAMVGWSWVVLAGEMIVRAGAVGSMLAFGAGAVMVWLVGLTYAELSAALSRAGGELSFTFVGLGPGGAFVCGWTLVLAYVAVCAFEAVALPTVVGYLAPGGFEAGFLYEVAGWDVHLSWVATGVAGSVAIGAANYFGIRFAAFVQRLAVASLLLIGLAFFLPGTVRGDAANLVPYFTGWDGVLRVVIMTPFLYVGFDVIPQLAEEIDVPMRTIGRVIVLSILMALGWYALVQWTVGLSLDSATLDGRELPTADAMSAVYGSPWAGRVLVVGGAFGILTSWNAFFLGASRLLFAMARGGMLPAVFARLHPRHGSPVAVIVLLTAVSALAPFFRTAGPGLAGRRRVAGHRRRLPAGGGVVPPHPPPPPGPAPPLPHRRADAGRLAGGRGHTVLPRPLPAGQSLRPRLAPGVGHRPPVDRPRGCLRDGNPASRRVARPRTAGPAHPGGLRGSAHFEPCVAASSAALSVARDPVRAL